MSNRTESFLVGLVGRWRDAVAHAPTCMSAKATSRASATSTAPSTSSSSDLPGHAVGDLLQSAYRMGFNGLNITHPCKQLVLEHLDEISPDAGRLGAVNTVVIQDGRFIGHNTDFSGFAAALASGLPDAKLDRVVQLGAGGAGSAVAYALLTAGVQTLDLVDMDPARCAERAAELAGFFPDRTVTARTTAELPQLMPRPTAWCTAPRWAWPPTPARPLDMALVEPRHWVADIVYRPIETELVREARAKGCEVLDGGRMAVGQAADAFRIFTGLEADADRMRAHFLELVAAEEVAA